MPEIDLEDFEPEDALTALVGGSSSVSDLRVFDVTQYGATGLGVADDRAGIAAAAAALTANGSGVLYFPPGGTYRIFESAGGFVAQFTGLSGLHILSRGATLAISTTNPDILTTQGYGSIFNITNCSDVVLDVSNVTGPDMSTTFVVGSYVGVSVCQIIGGCVNVSIRQMKAQGVAAVMVIHNEIADANTTPNRNIYIGNLYVSQSIYAISGQHGVYGLHIENLTTDQVYRSLILGAGLRDIRANIQSKNAYGTDVSFAARSGLGIDGVKLNFRRGVESSGPTSGGSYCVAVAFGDSTPAVIRDIDVHLNVEYDGTTGTGSGPFQFQKYSSAGVVDVTDRGHVLDGLQISGVVRGLPEFPSEGLIGFDPDARFGGSLDSVRGVVFRDLIISSTAETAIDWACDAVRDTVIIDNVDAGSSAIRLYDDAFSVPTFQTSFTAKIRSTGSKYSNQFVLDSTPVAYPIEHRNMTLSSSAVPGPWMTNLTIANPTFNTDQTQTLPLAVPGLVATFLNNSPSNIIWRLDPINGTDKFRAAAGGKYIELAAGAIVSIRCIATGLWEVTSSTGTVTYEP